MSNKIISKKAFELSKKGLKRNQTLMPYSPLESKIKSKIEAVKYTLISYDAHQESLNTDCDWAICKSSLNSGMNIWINIDGLEKKSVEQCCTDFGIHYLAAEDILNKGQRAKMDEYGNVVFCIIPMLFYNDKTHEVEIEQVSLAFGTNFLLSFQEEQNKDLFDNVRANLKITESKVRTAGIDYLTYVLLDVIVDHYFVILEKLGTQIETIEEQLLVKNHTIALAEITLLRREVMVLRRAILPVRDLLNNILKSENPIIQERNKKYFKDVLDHSIQANEYVENLREMLMNLQDLYLNQINLRMNEVMKIFTMVATLLAPATVIGGVFGMNFNIIPLQHHALGFYFAVGAMFIIPVFMLIGFKRKGWF